MADEKHILRTVSWTEVFSFPHVFKSFKMAIHPSKIVLALLAIVLTVVLGCVMDWVWAGASSSNWVQANEAWTYWTSPSRKAFLADKDKWRKETRVDSLASWLRSSGAETDSEKAKELAQENSGAAVRKVKKVLAKKYDESLEKADETLKDDEKRIEEDTDLKKTDKAKQLDQAHKAHLQAKRAALIRYVASTNQLEEVQGKKIFSSFLDWQLYCVSNALSSVRRGNFSTGLKDLYDARGRLVPAAYRQVPNRPITASLNDPEAYGLASWLVLMLWSLWWLFSTYPIYSVLYILAALGIWAVCGGAICRIAALHAAREEKISIASAVKFSTSKLLSFMAAPLLPLVIIVIIGLIMAAVSFIGLVPYIGELLTAILFFLALIGGSVMAFLAVGLLGGAPLMWPTIAVEGSDSFDAVSRSFSYVFARPFRYGLYLLVAAVHGTICYLFVRLFAFLTLAGTHRWVGWTLKLARREYYADGAGKLDVMWAPPTFTSFHGPMQTEATLRGTESLSAYIIALWVYLVAGVVLAFLVCYAFSAATNIYLILRRKVDATDLDDVYVEEPEEGEEAAGEEAAPAEDEQADKEEQAEEKGEEE